MANTREIEIESEKVVCTALLHAGISGKGWHEN